MLQWIQNPDWRLLDGLRGLLSCSFLDALMPLITHLGDAGAIWILCGMALLASKKYRKNGLWLLCGLAIGVLIGNVALNNHPPAKPGVLHMRAKP